MGAGRGKTYVTGGGFNVQGTKEDGQNVIVKNMTIWKTKGSGLSGCNGLSFVTSCVHFTNCGFCGVNATQTKGRMIDCQVTHCQGSGIASNEHSFIEIEGNQTKVEGTGMNVELFGNGLDVADTTSFVYLLSPLTKESVSINNFNGTNWGGKGTIETVNSFSSVQQFVSETKEGSSLLFLSPTTNVVAVKKMEQQLPLPLVPVVVSLAPLPGESVEEAETPGASAVAPLPPLPPPPPPPVAASDVSLLSQQKNVSEKEATTKGKEDQEDEKLNNDESVDEHDKYHKQGGSAKWADKD
jgi:hypothetical protein